MYGEKWKPGWKMENHIKCKNRKKWTKFYTKGCGRKLSWRKWYTTAIRSLHRECVFERVFTYLYTHTHVCTLNCIALTLSALAFLLCGSHASRTPTWGAETESAVRRSIHPFVGLRFVGSKTQLELTPIQWTHTWRCNSHNIAVCAESVRTGGFLQHECIKEIVFEKKNEENMLSFYKWKFYWKMGVSKFTNSRGASVD